MGGRRMVVAAVAAVALIAGCSSDDDTATPGSSTADTEAPSSSEVVSDDAAPALEVEAVSTDAERVSGGDVLLAVDGAEGDLDVSVDGEPAEAEIGEPTDDGSTPVLVSALPDGESEIEVASGDATGSVVVTNHPIAGPVFSGPHLEPLLCTTEENGLGPALDDDCSADTVVRWSYVTTEGDVLELQNPESLPKDIELVRIGDDRVPFIVRSESGTIDRGVYWIHVLDPFPGEERWDDSAWSGTLVYRFGGGCGTSYSQGSVLGDSGSVAGAFFDAEMLREGHAIATNTFNTFQVMCNDVLSAEAAMMTKERFAEGYGVPEHTIGEGGSGGAIQQYLVAQNYPGILDAIVAAVPFPDALSIAPGVVDCGLLVDFYESDAGQEFSSEQRAAVNGHAVVGTCDSWATTFLETIDPTDGCAVEPNQIYDPETNPDGVRCALTDTNVNSLGIDPDTGFARRPTDNTGVQYGWRALQDGVITVDQFLDLNEQVGGYDIDGNIVDERMAADAEDIRVLYEGGRINQGAGDLRQIPMFTLNLYSDPLGDIHDRVRSFQLIERLRLEDGSRSPNLVLWTVPGGEDLVASLLGTSGGDVRHEQVQLAIEWLDGLDTPAGERTPEELEAARPTDAVDRCVLPDGTQLAGGDELYEAGEPCAEAYPVAGEPRIAAGAPIDSLVGKCQLVPVDPDGYAVPFTAAQGERLEGIFPDGVCDWDAPGIGTADPVGPWLDYSDGPPGS